MKIYTKPSLTKLIILRSVRASFLCIWEEKIKYLSPPSLIRIRRWNIFGGSERRVGKALTYGRCQLRAGTVVSSIRLPFSRHLSRILSVPLSFTLYKWCPRLVAAGKIPSASPQIALFSQLFDLSIGFFGFLQRLDLLNLVDVLVVSRIKIKYRRAVVPFSMRLLCWFRFSPLISFFVINPGKVRGRKFYK